MTVHVKIMYGDMKTRTAPIDAVHKLPTHDVLFILVKDDDVEGVRGNIVVSHGFDSYALSRKSDGGTDWVMLMGWNDDDFVWRRAPVCPGCENRRVVDAPLGIMHIVFKGVELPHKDWVKAQKKWDKELV